MTRASQMKGPLMIIENKRAFLSMAPPQIIPDPSRVLYCAIICTLNLLASQSFEFEICIPYLFIAHLYTCTAFPSKRTHHTITISCQIQYRVRLEGNVGMTSYHTGKFVH